MRVQHEPSDSRMSRYWQENDKFHVCDDDSNVLVTLTGTQLLALIASHGAQAAFQAMLTRQMTSRILFRPKRLLGQHKALRGQGVILAPQVKKR